MRSAFAPAAVPVLALIASLARWWLQGSGNLYTAASKRFYVEDPDLGWRVSEETAIWLGLEACGLILAITCVLLAVGWLVRRHARHGRGAMALRIGAWLVAVVPAIVPVAAYASGWGPARARDVLPTGTTGGPTPGAIDGALAAPAGRYDVVTHAGTSISAQLRAGHETFDARFASGITGSWQGDPRDLARPMAASIEVTAAVVDTGIAGRTSSAKDTYLQVETYPKITFALVELIGAHPDGPGRIEFRARGTLGLLGATHAVEVTGTLREAEPAVRERLGLTGDILLATADLDLAIGDTKLAKYADDFDTDRIPIHISLVLHRTGP